jgi:NAD(P)H-nitrite reductase large subunit
MRLFRSKPPPSKVDADAQRVVVIGNGIAGMSAALRIRERQATWQITVISGESLAFYSRPALMYIFMGHMRFQDTKPYPDEFWTKKEIKRIQAWVLELDPEDKTVVLDDGQVIRYDKLLLATGSKPNKFGWPGQDLEGVQGLYSLQDLARLESNVAAIKVAVIVGGGLIGVELAEMLHSRKIETRIIARESEYWNNVLPDEEAKMVGRVIREHGVSLDLSEELESIQGTENDRVCGITLKSGRVVECQFVGLTAGVRPNIELLRASEVETNRGILVDQSFHTTVKDIYAAGDCAEFIDKDKNIVEQLWYTGKMQGEAVGDVISGRHRIYDRGVWFNSAKFFDLEYQTYGRVPSAQEDAPRLKHYLWTDHDRRGLRLVTNDDGCVVGMNAMGLRHRHRVWEKWIHEGRDLQFVLDHFSEAEFDSEFTKRVKPQFLAEMGSPKT